LAANPDPAESAVERMPDEALRGTLRPTGVRVLAEEGIAEEPEKLASLGLWRWLLLLALLAMLTQAGLAMLFTRRKHAKVEPIKTGYGIG
jgi:hypothetical protein